MFDKMEGNLVGTTRISDAAVLQRFEATPTDMTMQMYMGMVMYAPTDKLTLMAMFPYIRKSMNHITRDGERFTERTGGIGDIELRALYSLYARKNLRHRFLLNAGIGLPTGSINRRM
ncbi:MAG: transporter, partial [Pyrinomonadaceae bacterium]